MLNKIADTSKKVLATIGTVLCWVVYINAIMLGAINYTQHFVASPQTLGTWITIEQTTQLCMTVNGSIMLAWLHLFLISSIVFGILQARAAMRGRLVISDAIKAKIEAEKNETSERIQRQRCRFESQPPMSKEEYYDSVKADIIRQFKEDEAKRQLNNEPGNSNT